MSSRADPAPRQPRILRGVLLITMATGFFVVMNTGAKLLTATCFFFTALTRVPLADGTAISFTSPFVVAGLAGPLQALILLALGFLGGLGHHCVARALRWGPASILPRFHYTQLILAALAGYLVLGDVPGAWTWSGAAIIIASGLHIVWRETSR